MLFRSTITFRYYDNIDVDQSEDMGKIFSGRLSIEEGTVNPNIKYKVTLNGNDFSVDNNIKETIKNGRIEFNVIPNEGYTLGSVVSCDNEAIGVIENNKVIVSNITSDTTCTLDNEINKYTITMEVINGVSNALNKIVEYDGNAEFIITPTRGYTLEGSILTGDNCILEGNKVKVNNVKSDGTCTLTLDRKSVV